MLKKSFQKELDKLSKLNIAYKNQLALVEEQIFKEFGKYPTDCDFFIDIFHVSTGKMTVQQLNDEMVAAE